MCTKLPEKTECRDGLRCMIHQRKPVSFLGERERVRDTYISGILSINSISCHVVESEAHCYLLVAQTAFQLVAINIRSHILTGFSCRPQYCRWMRDQLFNLWSCIAVRTWYMKWGSCGFLKNWVSVPQLMLLVFPRHLPYSANLESQSSIKLTYSSGPSEELVLLHQHVLVRWEWVVVQPYS